MRPLRFLVPLLLAALVSAGCGDDNGTGEGELGLRESGTLTIGSNVAYAPFEFLDAGQPTGFDIDIITEIASRLDLEIEIVNNPSFDALIPSLIDGQYDAVISAMTITDERAEQIAFSDGYFEADQSLTVNVEETPDLRSADDLTSDMVIGVERGTTGADYAEENFADRVAEIRIFDNTEQSLADLANGRIQAVVNDFPVSAYAAQTEYQGTIEVVERFETGESYGIGVAQENDELLEAINNALQEMRDDGTYDEIFRRWFGEGPGGNGNGGNGGNGNGEAGTEE